MWCSALVSKQVTSVELHYTADAHSSGGYVKQLICKRCRDLPGLRSAALCLPRPRSVLPGGAQMGPMCMLTSAGITCLQAAHSMAPYLQLWWQQAI